MPLYLRSPRSARAPPAWTSQPIPRAPPPLTGANARKFFVGGNWKANGSLKQVESLVKVLNGGTVASSTEVVVAPSAVHLASVKSTLRKDFGVAGQVSRARGRARPALSRGACSACGAARQR